MRAPPFTVGLLAPNVLLYWRLISCLSQSPFLSSFRLYSGIPIYSWLARAKCSPVSEANFMLFLIPLSLFLLPTLWRHPGFFVPDSPVSWCPIKTTLLVYYRWQQRSIRLRYKWLVLCVGFCDMSLPWMWFSWSPPGFDIPKRSKVTHRSKTRMCLPSILSPLMHLLNMICYANSSALMQLIGTNLFKIWNLLLFDLYIVIISQRKINGYI